MDTGFKPLLLPGGPFWVWVGGGGGGGSGGEGGGGWAGSLVLLLLASSPGLQLCRGKAWFDCVCMHEHSAKSAESEYVRIFVGLYVYGQFYGKVYGKSSTCACSRYQAFPLHN